jgi:acyl transferase domain-containing protein/acyl carrier protein
VLLEEYVDRRERVVAEPTAHRPALVVLSARNEERLREQVRQLIVHLQAHPEQNLYDIAYTLQVGRDAMEHRLALSVVSTEELSARLNGWLSGEADRATCQGEVKKHRDALSSFNLDEETGRLIGKWVEKGKWGKLLEVWTKGLSVHWQQLYAPDGAYAHVQPRRLSLPTYAFARERCWVESSGSRATSGAAELHPLVHRNTSRLGEQRFSSTLSPRAFYLSDHVINGQRILPAVAFLEMARAAVLQSVETGLEPHADSVDIEDALWLRPLIVDSERDVQIALYPCDDGSIEFEVYTHDAAGEEVVHAQGRAQLKRAAGEPERIDLQALTCEAAFEAPKCYEAFSAMGIEYGPAHRALKTLQVGRDAAGQPVVLGHVELPGCVSETQESYVLHPSVLDATLQACIGLGLRDEERSSRGEALVPFALERIQVYKPSPRSGVALVRAAAGAGSTQKFDVLLCDEQGEVCVRLKGLSSRVLQSSTGVPSSRAVTQKPEESGKPVESSRSGGEKQVASAADDFREQAAHYLKKLLSGVLKLPPERIESDVGLEKYGIDSLMALKLVAGLEAGFGPLPKTLMFEYQSINELAGYFLEQHRDTLLALLKSGEASASSRSEGESDAAAAERARAAAPGQSKPEEDVSASLRTRSRRRARSAASGAVMRSSRDGGGALDIAIIGVSGRYPAARDLAEYWENLKAGRDCIMEVPEKRWDHSEYYEPGKGRPGKTYSKWGGFIDGVDEFDPQFFNISPREAVWMDPQERLFLQCAYETLEDAGYTRAALKSYKAGGLEGNVGVFVGVMYEEYQLYGAQAQALGQPYALCGNPSSIANRVSYFCNFHGPSMSLDTMCSGSLTAIHLACESLRNSGCELALAGGVNVTVHPNKYLMLSQGQFASSNGRCESFGKGGDGYVPGEGVGAVLLKPLAQAEADGDHIYAVIKGTSINHGGKTNGYTVPNPVAQAQVIARALKQSGVDARAISYIEAHGTGTSLGDPIEISGLTQAFSQYTQDSQYCAIGSAKSNIGHLESAAGIAGLTKVLLQMRHGQLAPSLHSQVLNPHIDFERTPFRVQQSLAEWQRPVLEVNGVKREFPRIAGISSFGAGGANAHVILQEYWHEARTGVPVSGERPALIVLSAKSEEQLREQARRLLAYVGQNALENAALYDLAYTLQVGREAFEYRLAFTAMTTQQLQEELTAYLEGRPSIDGCYRGEVERDREALSRLSSDADFSEVVTKWLQRGKYHSLLELWVKGLTFDWQRLYGEGSGYSTVKPRRMPLPTYPFARERCWIEPIAPSTAVVGTRWIHPLVHRNTSSLEGQRFSTELSAESFYLRDHVVQGRRTLPGVCYLEMVRAGVLASLEDSSEIVLKNVVWSQALVVEDRREVHLGLQVDSAGEIEFEVYTLGRGAGAREAGNKQAETQGRAEDTAAAGVSTEVDISAVATDVVVHAQGRVVLEQGAPRERVDVEALRSRSTRSVSRAECYEQFARVGLKYGESHQGVDQLHAGEDDHGRYVLGELRLPQAVSSTRDEYVLHPSVLDSALQATVALLGEQDAGKAAIPFAVERVEILARTPARGWVCVRDASGGGRIRSDGTDVDGRAVGAGGVSAGGSGSSVRRLDLQVLDEAGWECVRLKGFSTRVLEAHAGDATDAVPVPADATLLLKKQWVEVETTDGAAWTGERLVWLDPAYEAHAAPLNVPVRILQSARVLEDASVRQLTSGADATDAQRPTDAWRPDDVCWEVLEQLRSVLQGRPKKPLWLQVVLREQAGEALSAALAGLLKSATQENPKIRGEVLRVPADVDGEQLRQLLSRSADGTEQRHVSGRREVASLQALAAAPAAEEAATPAAEAASAPVTEEALAPAVAAPAFVAGRLASPAHGPAVGPVRNSAAGPTLKPWKNDGVYLLTGGAGGLGLIFAEEIARSVQNARLILTGRSVLSDAREDQLQQLRDRGAQVEYQSMDVSDHEQVQACIRSIVERHGRLDGIVHSAGVLRDSYLIKKTEQEYRHVISAKILGARNLDAATQGLPLDCFILFASTSGVFGNIGQSDYACANGWLDGYAQERNVRVSRGEVSGRTLSIDWPLWADGGMKVDEATLEAAHSLGIWELSTRDGIDALYAAWRSGESQVVVTCGPQPQLRQALQLPLFDNASASATRPSTKLEESGSASVLFDKLVQLLKAQISQQLNLAVERIKIDVPLHELGYDSVALTSLRNQLHRTCGIELSPTIFFEYPTVRALATYLVAEQGAALSEKLGIKPQSTGSLAAQQLGGDITVPGRKLPDIGTGTGSGGPHAAEHTAEAAHAPNVTPAKAGRRRRRMERSSPAQDARGTHDEPIAIIGTSGRFPGASDVSQFWENLKSGTDCITAVPADRWDHSQFYSAVKDTPGKTACAWGGFLDGVNEFDPLFFNISPNQARQMDPQELLFLETVWILLESRGYTRAQLQNCVGNKVGVYVGSMYHAEYAGTRSSDSAAQPAMHCHSSIANRVSHFFGFYGPSVAVDTMCSSSTMAIHVACKDLLRGECDMAIAGGVNLTLHPDKYLMLSRSQMLGSSAHSRSFGDGDGYLPAECVGAVLLKRLSSVVPDEDEVLAVIRGSAASHAGNANAYAVPNPASQAALIEEVLRRAGVDARSISYVEASATGAAMADALEIKALQTVFGSAIRAGECAIGSVKSAIGHAEAASGVSQVVKVVEQLRHRQLAPIVMPEKLNPALQLEHTPFRLQTQLQPWKRSAAGWPRRALVNSFGAGGSYVSLLLEEHVTQPEVQKQAPGRAPEREEIIVLSARTDERVRAAAENLLRYLDSHPEVALNDLAYTLQVGREPMSSRVAWVIGSRQELHAALTSYLHGASAESAQPGTPRIFHSENSPQQDLQSLLSGNAGRALANSLIAERNLEQLARLWTQGVEIVWSGLHGVGTRKIALPTYPFRRERLDRPFGNDVPTQGGPQTGGTNSAPAGAPATAVRQYLEQFMARQLGTSAADLQDHRSLGEYGVDSLIGRRLIRGLEETFGLQLSGRQLQENSTLATLVPLVASLLQEQRSDSAVHEPIPVVSETHEPAEQRATLQLRFLEQLRASALSDEEIEQLIEQGSLV